MDGSSCLRRLSYFYVRNDMIFIVVVKLSCRMGTFHEKDVNVVKVMFV